jgi:UDP-2,3-diacylglucosamine pyrophosphatase LpxH
VDSVSRPSLPPEANNYLLFSDVHLGADLVQHAQPWTAERLREAHQVDHELGSMLDHYRERSEPGRPWRLVIAGDFIDLVGMSISAAEGTTLSSPLNDDEREHGLGSSHEHAAVKMRAVAERHDALFRKLARFVDAGHYLVLIRGNHDVELYWEAAQQAFVDALLARRDVSGSYVESPAAFGQRVEFRHWFYYVRGLLYVEHGHQYDPTCAYQHVLAPLSPRDPFRISYSFSDILLRYVVRPTRELSQDGHENNSLWWYLRLAFSLGVGGCARLGYRFFGAVARMVSAWRDHLSEHATQVRAEHEQRLHQLAVMFRLSSEHLQKMTQLWATPVTARLFTIFRTVFLDGLAIGLLSALIIALLGVAGVVSWVWLPQLLALVSVGMFFYATRTRVLDPHASLRAGAAKLAEIMPARYYVMGHTHKAVMEQVRAGSTYVNLGNWSVDLADVHAPKAPCSHLVIRYDERSSRHTATLYGWNSASGAAVMSSDAEREAPASSEPAALRPGTLQTQPVTPRT